MRGVKEHEPPNEHWLDLQKKEPGVQYARPIDYAFDRVRTSKRDNPKEYYRTYTSKKHGA